MGFLNGNALKDWLKNRRINNLLTTEKGFWMDARQGPVIQGEIDEVKTELDEINSKLQNLKTLHLLGSATTLGSFTITNYRDYSFLLFCTNGGGWHDSRMFPSVLNPTFRVTASDTVFKVVHHNGTVTVSFQTQGSAAFGEIRVYGILL